VRELAERGWFLLCLTLGRLLRAGRYSRTRIVRERGEPRVRKRRRLYAPLLVRMGNPLLGLLDTGVRVLSQPEWEERERAIYQRLHATPIRTDAGGTLVLPYLPGETLATLLESAALGESVRRRAIALAAVALAAFHRAGLSHGDAMAENVMVDLEAGVAHWFDFETVHDASRPMAWRRADDVRALLASCLLRTSREQVGETLGLVLDTYADEGVTRLLAVSFGSSFRRPLAFHLGQAGLSFRQFREIAHRLRDRLDGCSV